MRRLFLLILLSCSCLDAKPLLVVTTTLLATAVKDVSAESFDIEVLMPSGTCPGQFDLAPSQADQVPKARLILRHEMQGFLDKLFIAAGASRQSIVAPEGSFTIPEAYNAFCEKVAAELAKVEPGLQGLLSSRLAQLHERLNLLSAELRAKAAPLSGTRVVCARFQADLASWLGLAVVHSFPPAEDPSPLVLRSAVEAGRKGGAALVVGNIQNGERVPQTIAEALKIPHVMLGNFPIDARAGAQDDLMRQNLENLLNLVRARAN